MRVPPVKLEGVHDDVARAEAAYFAVDCGAVELEDEAGVGDEGLGPPFRAVKSLGRWAGVKPEFGSAFAVS